MNKEYKIGLKKIRQLKLVRDFLTDTKTFSKRCLVKELGLMPITVDEILDKLIEVEEVRSLGYGLFIYYKPKAKKRAWNIRYY